MTVYVISLAAIAVYAVMTNVLPSNAHLSSRSLWWFSRLTALQLIMVLALRHRSVGVDVVGYLGYFERASAGLFTESRFEPAFLWLTNVAAQLTSNPQLYLALLALLSIAPIAYSVERLSPSPLLSWTLYISLGFYAFTFSGLRQSIALAVTTLSFVFIRRRLFIPYLLLILLASQFHSSAWMFAPAYFIYQFPLRRAHLLLVVPPLAVLLFMYREALFLWFTNHFYTTFGIEASDSYNWMAFSALLVILVALRLDALRRREAGIVGFLNLAITGVLLMIFASVGSNVVRMADYYLMSLILLLPAALATFSARSRLLIGMVGVTALVVIYFIQMASSPYSTVPYRAFWEVS